MKIQAIITAPKEEHPRRPVLGFACTRTEISGQRLWRLFAARFGAAENFFARHFVVNYCPLAFLESTGRNRTPDKLPPAEAARLHRICDAHMRRVLELLRPAWVIGVGEFAARRARILSGGLPVQVGQILHPSPASPLANKDWPGTATAQLQKLGVWT
jgi:single-strand selective monofunctional uracil DNA glycosylase